MFKIHTAMMFCVSTHQVMRQRGLIPVLQGHHLGQILLLPQQKSQILAQSRGGCWDSPPISELVDPGSVASSQPADGTVPACSHPVPAHGSQELSALELLLLPSSHPPQPPERWQQPLVTLLAEPKDSHTISVHQGKGHSWLLLSHCKSPLQNGAALFSLSPCPYSHGYVKPSVFPQRRKIPLNKAPS